MYSLCRERAAAERNKHSTHHCSFRLAISAKREMDFSIDGNRRPSRRAATRCRACGSYQPTRCPDARMANAYPLTFASSPWQAQGASPSLRLPGEGLHQSGRYRVNSSSKAAEPTGLLRYRSIPASRASSRPGCSLLAVSAMSRRFCSRGR